jgi:excisionase family DNA binding protein
VKDELISAADAAEKLGVTKRRVIALINAKNPALKLPATKIGSQYVIRAEDLEAVRERRAGRPEQAEPSPAALAKRRSRARKG